MITIAVCSFLLVDVKANRFLDAHGSEDRTYDLSESLLGLVDDHEWLAKRNFANSAQLLTYASDNVLGETEGRFNINIAISGCKHRVRWSTKAGRYTFADGHTSEGVTAGEIIDDLKTLKMNTGDHLDFEQALAQHTLLRAQSVATTSQKLLDDHLICSSSVNHTGGDILHDELRKLLWIDIEEVRRFSIDFRILTYASALAGAVGGAVTGLGTARILYSSLGEPPVSKLVRFIREEYGLEVTATDPSGDNNDKLPSSIRSDPTLSMAFASASIDTLQYERERSQAKKTGIRTGFTAGLTVFYATVTAGVITNISSRRRLRGEQAAAANILFAQVNGLLTEFSRQFAVDTSGYLRITGMSAPLASTSTRSSSGLTSASSLVTPSPSPGSSIDCVSPVDAAAFAGFLGLLDTTSSELSSLGLPDTQPFSQIEHEILNEVVVQGGCSMPNIP